MTVVLQKKVCFSNKCLSVNLVIIKEAVLKKIVSRRRYMIKKDLIHIREVHINSRLMLRNRRNKMSIKFK